MQGAHVRSLARELYPRATAKSSHAAAKDLGSQIKINIKKNYLIITNNYGYHLSIPLIHTTFHALCY